MIASVHSIDPYGGDTQSKISMILAKHPCLSAKDVFCKLKETYFMDVSYQYIHKILKMMREQHKVSEISKKYQLNDKWLSKMKRMMGMIENNYDLTTRIIASSNTTGVYRSMPKEYKSYLSRRLQNVLKQEMTRKLDEWYCAYYDKEDKEYQYLKQALPQPPATLLELGCGTGRITRRLVEDGYEVVAIDYNKDFISYARQTIPQASFVKGNIKHIKNLVSGRYDAIISTWTGLHHYSTETLRHLFSQLNHAMTDKGRFIILEAHHDTEFTDVLDKLMGSRNSLYEKSLRLRHALEEEFLIESDEVIPTKYSFPNIQKAIEAFAFELTFENTMKWNTARELIVREHFENKDALELGEGVRILTAKPR